MSPLKPMPHQANPDTTDQAASWMATLTDETCSADDQRRFSRWLTRSNSHVHEFLRISRLLRKLQRPELWPEIDLEALVAQAKQSNLVNLPRTEALPFRERKQQAPMRALRLALAASLSAATVLVAVFVLKGPAWLHSRYAYSTGLGELRSVTLDDGSIVELDSKSSIRVRFTSDARWIQLMSGEAEFKVTKDPQRPFRVTTPLAEVLAVGTEFDVKTQANQTVVTVIEGRVAVAPQSTIAATPDTPIAMQRTTGPATDGRPPPALMALAAENHVLLAAGEQLVVKPGSAPLAVAEVDPSKATGWTSRRLYFEDTALSDVANEFARYSNDLIQIRDKTLAERRISGVFDSSNPEAVVRFLERYTDTRVIHLSHGWLLEPGTVSPK